MLEEKKQEEAKRSAKIVEKISSSESCVQRVFTM